MENISTSCTLSRKLRVDSHYLQPKGHGDAHVSNVRGCPYSDKVNIFICRYAWHYECFHPRLYFIQNIFPVSQRLSQTCGIRFLFKITVDIIVLFILVCFAWIRKQFLNRRREKIENKEQRSYYDRKYFSRLFIFFWQNKLGLCNYCFYHFNWCT